MPALMILRRLLTAATAITMASVEASSEGKSQSDGPETRQAEMPILLITSPKLAEAWKPFAQWKSSQGRDTQILTTAEIGERQEGSDLQDKMRRCIREYIDQRGTRWVILGGDSSPDGGVVPDRDTYHSAFGKENEPIPTDIYYLSPKDWDADGDGIHGEFEDDRESIVYPDGKVGIGRIPVRTLADVAAYTDKVIAYESNYPRSGFRDTMIYTCTEPPAYAKVRKSWDDHVSGKLAGGTVDRYFAHETPWDGDEPGSHELSTANWIAMFNAKRAGKLHLHGHGLFHCWVLENDELFTKKQVAQLDNEGAYPLVTTVSCFTGQFDAAKDPCIAESMLRAPKAGAIAIVAPAREGKPHMLNPRTDFPLMVREGKLDGTTLTMTLFWELGIGDSLTTGEALMQAKDRLAEKAGKSASFHMCLAELNLLGDPSLAVHPEWDE